MSTVVMMRMYVAVCLAMTFVAGARGATECGWYRVGDFLMAACWGFAALMEYLWRARVIKAIRGEGLTP